MINLPRWSGKSESQLAGLLTTEEAAELVGKSPMTIRRWAAQHRVTAIKIGKAWLIEEASLPRNLHRNLRSRIQALIERYSDDDNAMWEDQVPHLNRTQVVEDLKEVLDPDSTG